MGMLKRRRFENRCVELGLGRVNCFADKWADHIKLILIYFSKCSYFDYRNTNYFLVG